MLGGVRLDKEKGILGETPSNTKPKESLIMSFTSNPLQLTQVELMNRPLGLSCPHFDESDFRGRWFKLEQYFEAKCVGDR